MGSNKGKPSITKCRLTNNGRFREFDDMVKYKGTYRMREELDYFRELAIQTAAKGFNSLYLRDNQEIFLTKLADLRWINGFNDCTDEDFNAIHNEWHQVVLELVDDFNADDMYEFDEETEVLEVNVARISEEYIDLERIIYKKATAYD